MIDQLSTLLSVSLAFVLSGLCGTLIFLMYRDFWSTLYNPFSCFCGRSKISRIWSDTNIFFYMKNLVSWTGFLFPFWNAFSTLGYLGEFEGKKLLNKWWKQKTFYNFPFFFFLCQVNLSRWHVNSFIHQVVHYNLTKEKRYTWYNCFKWREQNLSMILYSYTLYLFWVLKTLFKELKPEIKFSYSFWHDSWIDKFWFKNSYLSSYFGMSNYKNNFKHNCISATRDCCNNH